MEHFAVTKRVGIWIDTQEHSPQVCARGQLTETATNRPIGRAFYVEGDDVQDAKTNLLFLGRHLAQSGYGQPVEYVHLPTHVSFGGILTVPISPQNLYTVARNGSIFIIRVFLAFDSLWRTVLVNQKIAEYISVEEALRDAADFHLERIARFTARW